MRLKDENYFQYYKPSPNAEKAIRKHRLEQESRYRFYLNYDSPLQCLEPNGLADDAVQARIEAHYTFLGEFLHPTPRAARDLHEDADLFARRTRIGMGQTNTQGAVLLAYLYICYLLAALLDEVAKQFEQAPTLYMANAGTASVRAATAWVVAEFPYFWFLHNDPPLWDRYNYCIPHTSDDELVSWAPVSTSQSIECHSTSTSTGASKTYSLAGTTSGVASIGRQ